jgi:DNA-binding response OmpR family regulator
MATVRKVLIADPELDAVRPLSRALRQRGYQVAYAPDGSKALEVAVLRHPDVILFDEHCTMIEPRSFAQILTSNPRTADIPVLLTTTRIDPDRARAFREGVLLKPYNIDEALSRVDHLLRRAETARELRGDAREIEGSLSQLPLPDLMQILAMNKRTGRLVLSHGTTRGEVFMNNGRAVNARFGEVEGEKALFRLLSFSEGSFAFTPGPPSARVRLERQMEDALLESARQADERARLWESLPAPSTRVALAPDATVPVDPHPVTAEVLQLMGQPRKISDLMDLTVSPDLEVMGAVKALLESGHFVIKEGEDPADRPILAPAEGHALRARLLRGRVVRGPVISKIVVCGHGPKVGRVLIQGLPRLIAVASEPGCLRSGFGTLGRLEVSETLQFDFVLLPTAEAARPLWKPFCNGAVGGLVLETSEASLQLARFLAFEMRLPLVVAAGSASAGLIESDLLPDSLRGAPAGAQVMLTDLRAAVRAVLVGALQPPGHDPSETIVLPRSPERRA